MKKKFLIIGSALALPFWVKAQPSDSSLLKVNKTEIDIVYGHYLQEGNHSAVTGGIGTEELVVYSPNISLKKYKGQHIAGLNAGIDVISSASADNIDAVMSSASELDARTYTNFFYGRNTKNNKAIVKAGSGFSIESDYFSLLANAGLEYSNKKNSTYLAEAKVYFDDLRWGRLSKGLFNPVELIYPAELRYKEWHDEYKRTSYNLTLGVTQIVNKRNIIGLFSETTYQQGLLSTPFHRIFLSDGSAGVEILPNRRWKEGIAIKLNSFLGGRTILKNNLSTYIDNFGIKSLSIENETALKLSPFFTLKPGIRIYAQSKSNYFKPYFQHNPNSSYFTSDYDLSEMQTYRLSFGARYLIKEKPYRFLAVKSIELSYGFYKRSDGLYAHIFSFKISLINDKK